MGPLQYTQTTHGFAVGDVIYHSGSAFAKAIASSLATAWWYGIVTSIPTANTFTVATNGLVEGLSGLTAGVTYYLSSAVAGALTPTEPSTAGQASAPVLRAHSATAGQLLYSRPFEISATPSVSGSRGGNVALADLLTKLASAGIIVDNTVA
jgi:hypothetical protein